MNYELCEQLFDAGFPKGSYFIERPDSWINPDNELRDWWNGPEYMYVPLLEELIEACGEGFKNLSRGLGVWEAEGHIYIDEVAQCFLGSTPTEAVAMLYLALHGKTRSPMEGR